MGREDGQLTTRDSKVQVGKRLGTKKKRGSGPSHAPRKESLDERLQKAARSAAVTKTGRPEWAYFLSSFFSSFLSSFGFNASAGMLALSLTNTASEMSFSPLLNKMIGTWLMDSAAVSITRL